MCEFDVRPPDVPALMKQIRTLQQTIEQTQGMTWARQQMQAGKIVMCKWTGEQFRLNNGEFEQLTDGQFRPTILAERFGGDDHYWGWRAFDK